MRLASRKSYEREMKSFLSFPLSMRTRLICRKPSWMGGSRTTRVRPPSGSCNVITVGTVLWPSTAVPRRSGEIPSTTGKISMVSGPASTMVTVSPWGMTAFSFVRY